VDLYVFFCFDFSVLELGKSVCSLSHLIYEVNLTLLYCY